MNYTNDDNVRIRLRKRRRKKKEGRRHSVSFSYRLPVVIVAVCAMTAMAGYIGAQDGSIADTGLVYSAHAEVQTSYLNIRIQSGDTIWGIASEYALPTEDIRKLVKKICDINDIKPGELYPGQIIQVPIPA